MRVLVTGHDGYIGSVLVPMLLERGYDVTGLDASAGQVTRATQVVDGPSLVRLGSALSVPEPDNSLDFVYTINVLHHLPSVADQQRAFAEMLRVLRPGGVLFLHVAAVRQDDATERLGARRGVDRPAKPRPRQRRQVAAVVDVRVREHHGVDAVGRGRQAAPVS